MTEKTDRYSLEKAQQEAGDMQQKIQHGVVKDYPEAEEKIEEEHVKELQRALRYVDKLEKGGIGQEVSSLVNLIHRDYSALTEPAFKAGLQNVIYAIQKLPDGRPTIAEVEHQSIYLGTLYRSLRSEITDSGLHAVGIRLVQLRAKWQEMNRNYNAAKKEYASVGLADQAEEAEKLFQQFPDSEAAWEKLGDDEAPLIAEIERFKDYTKDHPLISEEEKTEVFKRIKEIIQAALDDLRAEKE